MLSRNKSLKALSADAIKPLSQFYVSSCCQDQVHVVKQGVLGIHLDSSSHKLKRPKKLTSRWTVLTRCEKTGQHTLHVCKTDSPDSSVKDSFPVQTSWSIKSAHCLKSSQRMDIFKEEGFIIHMGRQIAYVSCPTRSELKGWMCAILEGVTLGFEYHCKVGEHKTLGVGGECMLVLTPECIALLCPLTGAPLRKWPFFLLTGCRVVDDTVFWSTSECEVPYQVTVNQHNVFTLYNVLCRYLAHTNSNVQPDISISKPEHKSRVQSPAENKYTIRETTQPPPPPVVSQSPVVSQTPPGLCANQLYLSQETCSEKMNYELLSSNHSDYSTGVSSAGSTYDSDIYELMENSGLVTDCIYEDMSSTSPLPDEGYMTSSGSCSGRFRFASRGGSGRSAALRHPAPSSYMNMEGKAKDHGESTLVPDQTRGLLARELSRDLTRELSRDLTRELSRDLTREMSCDEDATLRANCYEYIDIELPGSRSAQPAPPPQLPCRNKKLLITESPRSVSLSGSSSSIPRDRLKDGLKSYHEQMRLQKEMMLNFSTAVLDTSTRDALSTSKSTSRAFMNSAV